MLLARRIRGVSKATPPSAGESRLSNPLDTVSLLEMDCTRMYPSGVISALHGHSKFKLLFAAKTPCQRADNHSIHWTLRT